MCKNAKAKAKAKKLRRNCRKSAEATDIVIKIFTRTLSPNKQS